MWPSIKPKPRPSRHAVILVAKAEHFRQSVTEHRVRNISGTGVCIDQADTLQVRESVVVTVGNLETVGAGVRWLKEGLAGLKFAQPIDIQQAISRTPAPQVAEAARRVFKPFR